MDRQTGLIPRSINLSNPSIGPGTGSSFRWASIRRTRALNQWPCRDRDDPGGHLPVFTRQAMAERILSTGAWNLWKYPPGRTLMTHRQSGQRQRRTCTSFFDKVYPSGETL